MSRSTHPLLEWGKKCVQRRFLTSYNLRNCIMNRPCWSEHYGRGWYRLRQFNTSFTWDFFDSCTLTLMCSCLDLYCVQRKARNLYDSNPMQCFAILMQRRSLSHMDFYTVIMPMKLSRNASSFYQSGPLLSSPTTFAWHLPCLTFLWCPICVFRFSSSL